MIDLQWVALQCIAIDLMEQMHTFGTIGRDPRGRQITVVYFGIVDKDNTKIKAGDDAAQAKWFSIDNLPDNMAFDHDHVVKFAIKKLKNEIEIGKYQET